LVLLLVVRRRHRIRLLLHVLRWWRILLLLLLRLRIQHRTWLAGELLRVPLRRSRRRLLVHGGRMGGELLRCRLLVWPWWWWWHVRRRRTLRRASRLFMLHLLRERRMARVV
jgi:hypothetical protein